jgi:hypothetical protein
VVVETQTALIVESWHPLGEGLPSIEGERGRMVPLLSSIASELRAGERNPKREKKGCEIDIYSLGGIVVLH